MTLSIYLQENVKGNQCEKLFVIDICRNKEKKEENKRVKDTSTCNVTLANGKAIPPALMAKLKSQIEENEKRKYYVIGISL